MTLIVTDELASSTGTLAGSGQVRIDLPSGESFSVPVTNLSQLAGVVLALSNRTPSTAGENNALIDTLTLKDAAFLTQVTQTSAETPLDQLTRVAALGTTSNVVFFLSTTVLTTAPVDTPSGTVTYVGGNSFKRVGEDFVSSSARNSNYVYLRVTGNIAVNTLPFVTIIHRDSLGSTVINRYPLLTRFDEAPFSTTTNQYYVLVSPEDTPLQINVANAEIITAYVENTNPTFTLSDNVKVSNANVDIDDIVISQLDNSLRDIVVTESTALTAQQIQALAGLTVTGAVAIAIADATTFRFKQGASLRDENRYSVVANSIGMPTLTATVRDITFLVDQNITLVSGSELRQVGSTSTTIAATFLGNLFGQKAYRASLPMTASAVFYQLNGTQRAYTLTGANSSFKILINNLSQAVLDLINSGPTPTPANIPEVLNQLAHVLAVDETSQNTFSRTSYLRKLGSVNIPLEIFPQVVLDWNANRRLLLPAARKNELPVSLVTSPTSTVTYTIQDITIDMSRASLGSTDALDTFSTYYFYGPNSINHNVFFPAAISYQVGGYTAIANNNAIPVRASDASPTAWQNNLINKNNGLLVFIEFTRTAPPVNQTVFPVANHQLLPDINSGIYLNNSDVDSLFGITDGQGFYMTQGNGDSTAVNRTTERSVDSSTITQRQLFVTTTTATTVSTTYRFLVPMQESGSADTIFFNVRPTFLLEKNGRYLGENNRLIGVRFHYRPNTATNLDTPSYTINFFEGVNITINVTTPTGVIVHVGETTVAYIDWTFSVTLSDPTLTLNFDVISQSQVSWNRSVTNQRVFLNSNDAINPITQQVDPSLFDVNVPFRKNSLMYLVRPVDPNDVTTAAGDIEVGIMPILNGKALGTATNGVIPLAKRVSEFDFTKLQFGFSQMAFSRAFVANIVVNNNFDTDLTKIKFLSIFNRNIDTYFGLMNGPAISGLTFTLDANLFIPTAKHISVDGTSGLVERS